MARQLQLNALDTIPKLMLSNFNSSIIGRKSRLTGETMLRSVAKATYTHEMALEISVYESGKQFYPDSVTAFMSVAQDFREIADECHDSDIHKFSH